MAGCVLAKDVYKEARTTIGAWAEAHGFTRWSETEAGWQKPLDAGRLLRFKLETSPWPVDPAMGSSLTGYLQLDTPPGGPAATPIRQRLLTSCLVRAELDRLGVLHAAINQRRPPLPPELEAHIRADSLLGLHLRSLYDPAPVYVEGQSVELSYCTKADVEETLRFVLDVLPAVVDRFVEGRVPPPVDTTPRHLKPKWLRGAG